MISQKDIAKQLGITQSTVSRALRNDPRISPTVRRKVQEAVQKEGYRPNAYVTALMSRIRTGKRPEDQGEMAVLVESASPKDWHKVESYRIFHQSVLQRGRELGFHTEFFFLQEPGMSAKRIAQILRARGISGVILAPPHRDNSLLQLNWEHYATVGAGANWEGPGFNWIIHDTLQNFITAFEELRQQGYRRVGTLLGRAFVKGIQHGIKWHTGYLEMQNRIPKADRIPVFISDNQPPGAEISEKAEKSLEIQFRQWFQKWQPDVLLTMVGRERKWLDAMGLKVPEDIGMACLTKPPGSTFAGIEDVSDAIGATAVELVAGQIYRNEFGPPTRPKTIIIAGSWTSGATVAS